MKYIAAVCVSCMMLVTSAWGQADYGEIDTYSYSIVGPQGPLDTGLIRRETGEIVHGKWVSTNERHIGYATFGTDALGDSRSSEVRYFTFYLRPLDTQKLSDVTVSVGVHYPPFRPEVLSENRFIEAAIITKQDQEAYFSQHCAGRRSGRSNCAYMPVSIAGVIPSYTGEQYDDLGGVNEVYLIDAGPYGEDYFITHSAENNVITRGLSLRMTPLARLANEAEAQCQGFEANIVGTKNGDILRGTTEGDVIVALGPNSIVYGGEGDDIICVVEGGSIVNGGPGDDRIYGSSKSDVLIGEDGDDRIEAGGGADSVIGGRGADTLLGGSGNDTIRGLDGRDTIRGQEGHDVCDGGNQSDRVDRTCEIRLHAERR